MVTGSRTFRASRVDANQVEIVGALRKAGRQVFLTHALGRDFPDLVVAYVGKTYLMEVKTKDGRLSDGQEKFIVEWMGGPLLVVRTAEEAIEGTGG